MNFHVAHPQNIIKYSKCFHHLNLGRCLDLTPYLCFILFLIIALPTFDYMTLLMSPISIFKNQF